jgi:formamidopyrimidine-DNA glycosylase
LPGRRIRRVDIFDEKLGALDATRLKGRVIRDVVRAGKEIVIDVSTPRSPLWWCIHLRMTGALLWCDRAQPPSQRHLRLAARLDRGALFFFDARRFGVTRLCDAPDQWAAPGVDPLAKNFTAPRLAALLAGAKTAIKPWLLRQDRLVGFGNIYASEVLFAARINPRRSAGSLTPAEINRLHRATRRVLTKAVECGGTTISDFADCEGESGGYQHQLKVYGREGERCKRCGARIKRLVQQGRSTFFCSACQR